MRRQGHGEPIVRHAVVSVTNDNFATQNSLRAALINSSLRCRWPIPRAPRTLVRLLAEDKRILESLVALT